MIKEAKCCRLCSSEKLADVIDFGATALANSYLREDQLGSAEVTAPLKVFCCEDCGSFQLKHTVSGEVLFSNYLYSSSTSGSLQKHFNDYAKTVVDQCGLKKGDLAIDIGSNDGVLLEPFAKLGLDVLGIEPASNLCRIAESKGLRTLNAFVNRETAAQIGKKASVVTCNNCFAHIDDLKEVVQSAQGMLKDDGYFIFENAYWLDSVKGMYFDQIYHEHIYYHSIKPLKKFLESQGFVIVNIETNPNQGGSIRVYTKKSAASQENAAVVNEFLKREEAFGLYSRGTYSEFTRKLDALKKRLRGFLEESLAQGKKTACYGAPAKATLFCKFFELDRRSIEFIVDDAPLKQGLYMPQTHLPIVGRDRLLQGDIENVIITAWNFAELIIANNGQFKGQWITPMPDFKKQTNS